MVVYGDSLAQPGWVEREERGGGERRTFGMQGRRALQRRGTEQGIAIESTRTRLAHVSRAPAFNRVASRFLRAPLLSTRSFRAMARRGH